MGPPKINKYFRIIEKGIFIFASYYTQLSVDIKMKNYRIEPVLKPGLTIVIYYIDLLHVLLLFIVDLLSRHLTLVTFFSILIG